MPFESVQRGLVRVITVAAAATERAAIHQRHHQSHGALIRFDFHSAAAVFHYRYSFMCYQYHSCLLTIRCRRPRLSPWVYFGSIRSGSPDLVVRRTRDPDVCASSALPRTYWPKVSEQFHLFCAAFLRATAWTETKTHHLFLACCHSFYFPKYRAKGRRTLRWRRRRPAIQFSFLVHIEFPSFRDAASTSLLSFVSWPLALALAARVLKRSDSIGS